jgi:hypothetical protein
LKFTFIFSSWKTAISFEVVIDFDESPSAEILSK